MQNDAKLGLIVGVGIVLTVAVVFFRKEGDSSPPLVEGTAAAAVGAAKTMPTSSPPGASRSAKAKSTSQTENSPGPAQPTSRRHVVEEGETLFSLAELYYGDKEKSLILYQANQEMLKTPERLTPGTTLVIPNPPVKQPAPGEKEEQP